MFDPTTHMIQLPRRIKDEQTGKYKTVHEEYLEVKWRLVWFRDRYPHGSVETVEVIVDLDRPVSQEVTKWVANERITEVKEGRGYARFFCRVKDGEGGVGTGYGTETALGFHDFVERAETRAIGRALATLGIGTQFVGEELTEGDHVADTPVTREPISETPANGHPTVETSERPTAAQVEGLLSLVMSCSTKEEFGRYVRQLFELPDDARVTKKLVRSLFTRESYLAAHKHYEQMLKEHIEADVKDYSGEDERTDQQDTMPRDDGYATEQEIQSLQDLASTIDEAAEQEIYRLRALYPHGVRRAPYEDSKKHLEQRLAAAQGTL